MNAQLFVFQHKILTPGTWLTKAVFHTFPQRPARWKAQRNFTLKCSVSSDSFAKEMSFMGCSNVSRHNQLPLSENKVIISPSPVHTQAGTDVRRLLESKFASPLPGAAGGGRVGESK